MSIPRSSQHPQVFANNFKINFLVAEFNREKEKNKLTTIFEYNGKPPRELVDENYRNRMLAKQIKDMDSLPAPKTRNRFAECMKIFVLQFVVVQEVEERKQFLDEMTRLGKAAEVRPIIQGQIAALVQEMKNCK